MNNIKRLFLLVSIITMSVAFLAGDLFAESKKSSARETKPAPGQPKVGMIDFLTLIVFHPSMQYYSFENNTFIRPLQEGVPATELLGRIRERQEKFVIMQKTRNDEIGKLKQELETIESELNKIRVKASREQSAINLKYTEEYTKLTADRDRKECTDQYHKQLLKLDEDFYLEKKKFEDRKSEIVKSINENFSKLQEINYLNSNDSKDFLNEIIDEINCAICEVAVEKKLVCVMNSNFVSGFIQPESLSSRPSENSSNAIASESSRTAETTKNADYSSIIECIDDIDSGTAADIENKKNTLNVNCIRLFQRRIEAAKLFAGKGNLSQMVVWGGEDITIEVLGRLLKKHSVGAGKIRIISDAVGKLLNPQIQKTEPSTYHSAPPFVPVPSNEVSK